MAAVLILPIELPLALFVYIGYQITFSLGNYLVRCETLLMVALDQLRRLDVAKQAGYLLGMAVAWALYTCLERLADLTSEAAQVVSLHWLLLGVEVSVLIALWQAFSKDQLSVEPLTVGASPASEP